MTDSRETKDTENNSNSHKLNLVHSFNSSSSSEEKAKKEQKSQIINVNIISNPMRLNSDNSSFKIITPRENFQNHTGRKESDNTASQRPLEIRKTTEDVVFSSDINESDSKTYHTSKNFYTKYQAQINTPTGGSETFDSNARHQSFNEDRDIVSNMKMRNNDPELKDDIRALVQEAMHYKRIGNDLFNKKSYNSSIDYYKKALIALNFNSNYKELFSQSNINTIKIDCLNNIAICFLLKKEYEKVLDFTQQVSAII